MPRRRLLGAALGVLSLVLLGVAFLLFLILLGSALGEERTNETAESALLVGFFLSGAGFLASLVGAIVMLASARGPTGQAGQAQESTGRGWRVALAALSFLVALWVASGLIAWNMGAASGGKAPLGSIVLILSLMGFATVFAGGWPRSRCTAPGVCSRWSRAPLRGFTAWPLSSRTSSGRVSDREAASSAVQLR